MNLSRSLIDRDHKVDTLSLFGTPSKTSLWSDRLKRTRYSAFLLSIATQLKRYDIVLFTEPLYPQNLLLLRYLKSRIGSHIVLWLSMPRITANIYYSLIKNEFPALITAEIAHPFAEKLATRVELLSPGVDVNRLCPLDTDKEWDFLYIGHLFREKGVLLLLQAMKVLKEKNVSLKLKIIYPSVEESYFRRFISENNLDNVFMERKIIDNHVYIYNSAKVYVYPGISCHRVADVPQTIIEASACGLPVVTTSLYQHINLPNITHTGTNPELLANAMLQTIDSWNLQKQAQTLFAIKREYSLESLGSLAEAFFTEVLNGKQVSR